jgi:hypothetical protein
LELLGLDILDELILLVVVEVEEDWPEVVVDELTVEDCDETEADGDTDNDEGLDEVDKDGVELDTAVDVDSVGRPVEARLEKVPRPEEVEGRRRSGGWMLCYCWTRRRVTTTELPRSRRKSRNNINNAIRPVLK